MGNTIKGASQLFAQRFRTAAQLRRDVSPLPPLRATIRKSPFVV
jgi:hypothetical protein